MTRKSLISLALITAFGSTACSSNPAMTSSQLKDHLRDSEVIVLPIKKPIQLAERTKAQAIGKMVVSSVAGSVAGSAGGAGNAQQMQANMQIGQSFGQNLQQALPDSYSVSAGQGLDITLAAKLAEFFSAHNNVGAKNQTLHIGITPRLWELGYVSMLTSHDYALNYNIDMTLAQKNGEKLSALKYVKCEGSAPEKMPLDSWKANHYEKVDTAAEVIINTCMSKFLSALELQQ